MRVFIEVTEAQHAELKHQAGLIPLSRWIRSQLFPVSDEARAKELIPLLQESIEKSKALIEAKHPTRADIAVAAFKVSESNPRTGSRIAAPVDMSKILP